MLVSGLWRTRHYTFWRLRMFLDVRCPGCDRSYLRLRSPICSGCMRRYGPAVPLNIAGASFAIAGAPYEAEVRRIVLAGKSQGRTAVFGQLVRSLTEIEQLERRARECETVTWVPGAPSKVRRRGYDQGKILAGAFAKRFGLRSQRMFRRLPGEAQTGLSRQQRQLGPRLVVMGSVSPGVFLVDDVVTTGVSMRLATSLLRGSGAESVVIAALTTRPNIVKYDDRVRP